MTSPAADLYVAGAEAAEDVLKHVFLVDVRKVLDPLDPGDFLVIIKRLQDALLGLTGPAEAAAMARALDVLDIDWTTATAEKQEAVMRAANRALQNTPKAVLPAIQATFKGAYTRVAGGAKTSAKATFGLDVSASLSVTDKKVAAHAAKAQAHYVRDEYGVRADKASELARKVVAEGLKNGLGRVEIGGEIEAALVKMNVNRSRAYYNMVSSVYAGRARQFGSLRAYEDAGIDTYVFEAVLDQVTSLQCRFMHGREFSVKSDLKRYKQVAASSDPEDVRFVQPWVNVGKDENGVEYLYTKNRDGSRDRIADVVDNAVGELDDTGSFATKLSSAQLQAKGCTCPPLHGNCRSTILPLV